MLILSIYIPPDSCNNVLAVDCITDWVCGTCDEFLALHYDYNIAILGDMNSFDLARFADVDLIRIVNVPTRNNAILDNIMLSSNIADNYTVEVGSPLQGIAGCSDHSSVFAKPFCHFKEIDIIRFVKVYDFRPSAMTNSINCLENVVIQDECDVNEMCNLFQNSIIEAFLLVPYTIVRFTKRDAQWMTPIIKSLINRRWDAFRKRNFISISCFKT